MSNVPRSRQHWLKCTSTFIDGIYTQTGTAELSTIFDGESPISYPKPSILIERLLEIVFHPRKNRDLLILDSFAGSGPTAHATLAQNKSDGGSRKFILVETEDYADTLTAERIRRVIKGVPKASDEKL